MLNSLPASPMRMLCACALKNATQHSPQAVNSWMVQQMWMMQSLLFLQQNNPQMQIQQQQIKLSWRYSSNSDDHTTRKILLYVDYSIQPLIIAATAHSTTNTRYVEVATTVCNAVLPLLQAKLALSTSCKSSTECKNPRRVTKPYSNASTHAQMCTCIGVVDRYRVHVM